MEGFLLTLARNRLYFETFFGFSRTRAWAKKNNYKINNYNVELIEWMEWKHAVDLKKWKCNIEEHKWSNLFLKAVIMCIKKSWHFIIICTLNDTTLLIVIRFYKIIRRIPAIINNSSIFMTIILLVVILQALNIDQQMKIVCWNHVLPLIRSVMLIWWRIIINHELL